MNTQQHDPRTKKANRVAKQKINQLRTDRIHFSISWKSQDWSLATTDDKRLFHALHTRYMSRVCRLTKSL